MDIEALQLADTKKVTVDQVRQMLHISKRKCAWMLQTGMIPCRIGQKKTRQYTIQLRDIEDFVSDFAAHPERYPLPPIFTAKPNRKRDLSPPEPPDHFREWIDDRWFGYRMC